MSVRRSNVVLLSLLLCTWASVGCGSSPTSISHDAGSATDAGNTPDAGHTSPDGGSPIDAGPVSSDGGSPSCGLSWSLVTTSFPSAGTLTACDSIAAAQPIVQTLMNLRGLTIDNNGTTMTPCIEWQCDSNYVYVISNSLPHYDFVQTTPNALVVSDTAYRVPFSAHALNSPAGATNATTMKGCENAYTDYVTSDAPQNEPSGFCGNGGYYYDVLADGGTDYHEQISCLGSTGFMIDGVPTFGPNEAQVPDPFGNPAYYWPDTAGETYGGSMSAALDLCGGHTSPSTMHYHAINDLCFDVDADNKPANSYVQATENFSFNGLLTDTCTAESSVMGWSPDGYPIKGPCVCVARNPDGSCLTLKRARSSWVYGGLDVWNTSGTPSSELANDGKACTSLADCCPDGGTCHYKCSHAIFNDASAAGGTTADQRCVLLDYSWCTNQYLDRSEQDVSGASFVYMDRCNGFDNGEGYAYYATGSFPFIMGCYHGAVAASTGGGMNMNRPDGGGMMPPPDGGSGANDCNMTCNSNQVCCPAGQPCAGMCVPDCRIAGNTCPMNLTCDESTGICLP